MATRIKKIRWADKPIIGMALITLGCVSDSYRKAIEPLIDYKVGKHIDNGMVMIIRYETLN